MSTRSTVDEGKDTERQEGRFGRLRPGIGLGSHVRCACDRCGAHVYAITLGADRYDGVCRVCGGAQITPVG